MLEIRDLRMVRAIQEQGSLARAARVLGIGQPAITRSLAALEARLQGPLFTRSRRGVVPTDLGRALLAEAGDLLDRLARLDRHLAEVRGAQVQTLTVVGGAYAIESFAMLAAARMLAVHPTVRIRLRAANWAEVPRAVREREAAIGVMELSEIGETADLAVEPLRPQPGIIAVRPGHPLAGVEGLTLADLMAWPLVFIGRTIRRVQGPMAAAREEARAAGRLHPAFPALIHESPTVALLAVRHSDAITPITVPAAESALRAGDVVALRWRAPWLSVHWGIIRPRHHRETEAEQAYQDLLRSANREAETAALRVLAAMGLDPATA